MFQGQGIKGRSRFSILVAILLLTLVATACGGGGSEQAGGGGDEQSEGGSEATGGSEAAGGTEAAATPAEGASGGDGDCEGYPDHTVEMIMPYAAGGGTDQVGRLITSLAPKYMDVPLRLLTMPGAGGSQGTLRVAEAEPDGYTLSFGTLGSVVTNGLLSDTGYTAESFDPVALMTEPSFVFVVAPDSPYQSLEDLVAASTERPGEISYGSSGAGGSAHTMAEAAAQVLGVEWAHVPFDGSSQAVVAAAGGNVDFAVPSTGSTLEQIEGGLVRPLAVTAPEPLEGLDAPTFGELGYDFDFTIWRGVFAPAGTPQCAIDFLAGVMEQIAEDPEFIEIATDIEGEPPIFTGPEETQERIDTLVEEITPVLEEMRSQGVTPGG